MTEIQKYKYSGISNKGRNRIHFHSKDTVRGGPKSLFLYTYNTLVPLKSGQPFLKDKNLVPMHPLFRGSMALYCKKYFNYTVVFDHKPGWSLRKHNTKYAQLVHRTATEYKHISMGVTM